MTQLMLFETPVSVTSTSRPFATGLVDRGNTHRGRNPARSENASAVITETPERGLHHMGDLARLVLMRYDLVAARRAAKS